MRCNYLSLTKLTVGIFIIVMFISCGDRNRISIGVSQNSSDDWREKMNREMLLEMYKHPEATLEIRSADNRNDLQIQDIEYFINKGVDVLVVSPREAEAITPSIKKAKDAGIKVLVFDREAACDCYDMFYGADNLLIGKNAAIYARRYIRPGNTADSPMGVIEIRGLDGSSPAAGRHKGFVENIAEDPRIEVLASVESDWTPEPAARAVDSLLQLYPSTELIYAHNDRMAVAAAETARKLGREDIRVIGVDGAPEIGLKAVADGKIDATFIYPTHGAEILNDAIELAKGEEKPKRNIEESALAIDNSNVDLQLMSARSLQEAIDNVKQLNERVIESAHRRSTMRTVLWALGALLLIVAIGAFIMLKLYWARKNFQEQLAAQNDTLRSQRDDLERLNTQLNEATASKLNFFTNVSHDLRTPLTLIATPLETLSEDQELSPHSKSLVGIAQKNVKILQRLINQILDFQKYESGKQTLHLVATDITADVRDWTSAFQQSARKRDIRIGLRLNPDAECVVALDREKIERVFFNLMSNAFRFTPANGSITVELDTSGEEIELSIKDTGKGIPAENIPHLFERFFQGREGNAGGSGIGLVVVKNFVELHGGRIEVESEMGIGTIFKVILPKRAATESTESSKPLSADLRQQNAADITMEISPVEIPSVIEDEEVKEDGKPVVLVVDDNDDLRHVVRHILESTYEVITASSGEDGLRKAMKYVPDCILSDVMMPGINGLELTRRLKDESVTSHIPIILLTACALDEQRAAGYDSGADGYLAKPFNNKVLLACVSSIIKNRKLLKAAPGSEVPVPEMPAPAKKKGEPTESKKPAQDPFSELDSAFYRNFVAMVNRDMGDSELSVEEMAARMGMSRVQFYRKLKALTNYSPADLLRLFRLRAAKDLLMRDEETTVAEVAYKVGFSSPSYFAKCFKDQFGELPSELQSRTSKIKG